MVERLPAERTARILRAQPVVDAVLVQKVVAGQTAEDGGGRQVVEAECAGFWDVAVCFFFFFFVSIRLLLLLLLGCGDMGGCCCCCVPSSG